MVDELLLRAKHEMKLSKSVPLVLIFVVLLLIVGIAIITYANTNSEEIKESQDQFMQFRREVLEKSVDTENGRRTYT
jgi:flagellar basal body-associated protein FliL